MPSLPDSSVVPAYLLKAKVAVPAPGPGHVSRESLLKRLEADLECRFAALQAPAGFGKTTLLAEFCRRKREHGVAVAWVSLDGDDTLYVFGAYLAAAFAAAGLDVSLLEELDAWSSSPATYQVGMVARTIDLHEAPCLLVLDEVDRVPQETLELIQRLLEHGPANLHFALSFRSNPGLDVAMQVFRGEGVVIGVEELRFSREEIESFFQGSLSRRELSDAEERTAGWPVALLLYRNALLDDADRLGGDPARLTLDFVNARLLRGLSPAERAFVCQLAVFNWIEADLVDEVLGSSDARVRIASLPVLDGLVVPIGEEGAGRLHPLVRDYCADLLAVEDPEPSDPSTGALRAR